MLTILSNLERKIVREVVCNLDLPKCENWSHHDVLALPKKEEKMEGHMMEAVCPLIAQKAQASARLFAWEFESCHT